MALFGLSREEKAYREFFKKTGIQITDEPILGKDEELNNKLEELHYKSRSNPRKAIPQLEKLIKKYPNIPSIKNFLFAALSISGQNEKAKKILEDTLVKHPKYVFGITNKIFNINDPKELKEYEHLLGIPKDVREFEGYDDPIHISAFKNYQAAVAHFELLTGNEDEAINRLETLIDLRVEKEFLEEIAQKIAVHRMRKMGENLEKLQETKIESISDQTVFLDNLDIPPKLNHSILEIFYQKSMEEILEEDFVKIETLPKETLIVDLENILEDSIRRWKEFQLDDYENATHEFVVHEFMIHALYWLGDLKSESSLNKVLNLLRMGEEFIDYWMADWYEEYFYPTLYHLGESQLSVLKNFILEDKIYPFYRLRVSEIFVQVAIHQPHRREEVVQYFQEIFDYLLENPNNQFLIDTNFIGFLIGDLIDFRGVELWDRIEALNKKGWIQKNIQGDIDEIKEELNRPFHESELKPIPLNIREFYSEKYKERKVQRPPLSEKDQEVFNKINNPSKGEALVMEQHAKLFSSFLSDKFPDDGFDYEEDEDDDFDDYYEVPETFVRTEKKVGRNDPCPCGSGKKYKKCCLNK